MADFVAINGSRTFGGHIDLYGRADIVDGWFFCGWIDRRFTTHAANSMLHAEFASEHESGLACLATYDRDELGDRGLGFVAFLPSRHATLDDLIDLSFSLDDDTAVLTPASEMILVSWESLAPELMPPLVNAQPAAERAQLQALLLTCLGQSGTIDIIGYDRASNGWFLLGWTARALQDNVSEAVTLSTHTGDITTGAIMICYPRIELGRACAGVLLFIPGDDVVLAWPLKLTLTAESANCAFSGASHSRVATSAEVRTAANGALKKAAAASESALAISRLLGVSLAPRWEGARPSAANFDEPGGRARDLAGRTSASAPLAARAYVDFYGYHTPSVGWLFCGWIPLHHEFAPSFADIHCTATIKFRSSEAVGAATIAYFLREDLGESGVGVTLHISTTARLLGNILQVDMTIGDNVFQFVVGPDIKQMQDTETVRRMRPLVEAALFSTQRLSLLALLDRRGFFGEDTMAEIADQVMFEIDDAVRCGPRGILLRGWYAARPNAVHALRLRCGLSAINLDLDGFLWTERQDVADAFAGKFEFSDNRCGFLAFVDDVLTEDAVAYVEVETARRSLCFKKLPAFRLRGMAAIRHIAEPIDLQYDEVVPALNKVLGPAFQLLNRERLRTPPAVTEAVFHTPPTRPKLSVIVALYGRLDFFEYQIALFSADDAWQGIELIYVLDDPPRRRELEVLAESVASRFEVPFRILYLDSNVGFAPANNIALAHATGEFVCYLNSDVFPGAPDWPDRLIARLESDPSLGAVGPLLVFEDGAVQHEGIEFKPIRMLGRMAFPLHINKSRRPRPGLGLVKQNAITGAFMLLRRALADELGGFDPDYAIGDFEDVDLCAKIVAKGLTCAIDHDVTLFHLERQSQAGPEQRWRFNLTLYNAWVFHRKWIWDATNGG